MRILNKAQVLGGYKALLEIKSNKSLDFNDKEMVVGLLLKYAYRHKISDVEQLYAINSGDVEEYRLILQEKGITKYPILTQISLRKHIDIDALASREPYFKIKESLKMAKYVLPLIGMMSEETTSNKIKIIKKMLDIDSECANLMLDLYDISEDIFTK